MFADIIVHQSITLNFYGNHHLCIGLILSLQELHTVFPLLLDNIYGFNNQPGWGLGRLYKSHYHVSQTKVTHIPEENACPGVCPITFLGLEDIQ